MGSDKDFAIVLTYVAVVHHDPNAKLDHMPLGYVAGSKRLDYVWVSRHS
jgi:hypothetical protein